MTSTHPTWLKLFAAIAKAPDQLDVDACATCGEARLAAQCVASSADRTGYAALWCSNCWYGIWVSRATVADGWEYATFEEADAELIPGFIPSSRMKAPVEGRPSPTGRNGRLRLPRLSGG